MKQYPNKFFSVALLLSSAVVLADSTPTDSVLPFLQWRSQGRNTVRKVVGETVYHVDQPDKDGCYGTFYATLEYDRSFRPQYITEALFGPNLATSTTTTTTNSCNKSCDDRRGILIQGNDPLDAAGAEVTRSASAWAAENLVLPNQWNSFVSFKPLVQNILVDLQWYMGFDRWVNGMYFRLYGPVVNNRTNMNAEETAIGKIPTDENLAVYDEGFFSKTATPYASIMPNALSYFAGNELRATVPGITYAPLQYAKINGCGNKSKTGFAELRAELGWNYLRENYRVGLGINAAAPTGTRPKGEWLLEPQIGNGKHWELGGTFKALWTMWRSEDEEKRFDFVFEADVTHLFNAKQTRTFDLKNADGVSKPNSRYMLAEQLDSAQTPKLNQSTLQFNGNYSPVANFSTRDCKVSIGAQGDLVAMFTYAVRGFTWDLGYNFWGMSHEKISLSTDCNSTCGADQPFPTNWALKGNASVYGGTFANPTDANPTAIVALAATQSAATIRTQLNNPNIQNAVIDTLAAATTGDPEQDILTLARINVNGTLTHVEIATSKPPVLISVDNLDISSAELRGYSNKVFTHFNYSWTNRDKWIPYVGFGASAEFGSHNKNDDCVSATTTTTTNSCNSGHNSFALSQWGIWLKGGVSYN